MEPTTSYHSSSSESPARVLVVADWGVDARAVIDACERRDTEQPSSFALLVPAWLHGIDWIGDPLASVPCARRQVAAIDSLATAAGRQFAWAEVGDPEPVAAICDALADWAADELLVCSPPATLPVPHPFDLSHRARRATGLPLSQVVIPANGDGRRRWRRGRSGHCVIAQPAPAYSP